MEMPGVSRRRLWRRPGPARRRRAGTPRGRAAAGPRVGKTARARPRGEAAGPAGSTVFG